MTNVKNQRINFTLFNLSVLLFIIASLSYHNYHHYCYHHHYYYHYFISLFARSLCSASLPRHNFKISSTLYHHFVFVYYFFVLVSIKNCTLLYYPRDCSNEIIYRLQ